MNNQSLKRNFKIAIVLACFTASISVANAAAIVLPGDTTMPQEQKKQTQSAKNKEKKTKKQEKSQEKAPTQGAKMVTPTPKEEPQPVAPAPIVPARPEAAYNGKTVVQLNIVGSKLINADDIAKVPVTKVGSPFEINQIESDLQAIYSTGWFYEVHPEFKVVPEGIQISYIVQENPLLDSMDIKGNTIYKPEEINKMITLEKGQIVNLRKLDENLRNIENKYKADGYILARVSDVNIAPDGKLSVTISEGIVDKIVVKGNKKTKTFVITREMRTKIGKPFNAKEARRSLERIHNLGYFEDVNVKLNAGQGENNVEVEITVVEQNTGQFMIGAGYSKADGFVGILGIGDKNFMGVGDSANIRWEFGGKDNKNYDFSYFKPWLTKNELGAGLSLYNTTHEYQDYYDNGDDKARYDRKRKGFELTLSQPISEKVKVFGTLKNREDIYVKAIDGYWPQYYEQYPERKKEDFGTTRSVTLGISSDTRDNIYNPMEGRKILFSSEFAGAGGDFNFNKFFVESSWYYKLKGQEQVIALRFNGGYATGTMPVSQRFAVGGAETLRGYKDDIFRGYKMLLTSAEYRFPIIKRIQGVVFTDYGYAWDKGMDFKLGDMKLGYGLGLRINSPLGPIRLDYGRGSMGGRFHFSFGGNF